MSSRFAAGSNVGHYRIVTRVGAGGMGEVFKAQDLSLDRPVALKILSAELVKNEDRVRRFIQEAKAASGLSHPHIVSIYEVGEIPADGQVATRYIAMEFVNGVTLRTKIYDQRATLKELLEYLAQAADALAKAHAAGIIHRDLKPDNIMVTQDGYAKVLDFGLAKLIENKSDAAGSGARTAMREQTRDGVVLGTLGYMSPEQARGDVIDHRSDIFSFGCILYEAAARQKPFRADTDIDVLHQIVHDEPAAISEINPAVPAELRRLIRRCLAKDPDRRYQSMKDLAIELRDLSQEFETLSTSTSAPVGALRRTNRRSWAAAALALIGIAAFIAALMARRGPPEPAPMTSEASFTLVTSLAGVETQPRLSPDGNFIVYTGGSGQNSDIFLQRLGGMNAINLTPASEADDRHPAISPDGQLIAFRSSRQGGGIFVMGATGESVRRVTEEGFFPAWSPDGKEIVYTTADFGDPMNRPALGQLWRVNIQTGQKKKVAEPDAVQPAWSPDGKRIAFWGAMNQSGIRDIQTVSAEGGEPIPITSDAPSDWNPIWSGDGKSLYFVSNRGGTMNLWIIAVDEATGKPNGPPRALTTPARSIGFIDISPDGKKLVFAATNPQGNIERVPFDPARESVSGPPQPVVRGSIRANQADVSPDGQWVVFRSEGDREDIYVVKSDGTEFRKLTDDIDRDRGPRWTPDGTRILFYSDRSGRYDIWSIRPDGSGLTQVTATTGESVWFPSLSPDGKSLMVQTARQTLIASTADPLPLTRLETIAPYREGRAFRGVAWSPDGEWIGGTVMSGDASTALGVALYSPARREFKTLADSGAFGAWLDGRRLIYRDGFEIILIDRQTGRKRKIAEAPSSHSAASNSVSIPAGGRHLYYNVFTDESDIWLMTMK